MDIRNTSLYSYFLVAVLFFISCKNNTDYPTQEKYNKTEETKKDIKYIYAVASAKQPKLVVEKTEGYFNGTFYVPERTFCSVEWYKEVYSSDIIEVEDYDEDYKYRVMDKIEDDVRVKIKNRDDAFRQDLFMKCSSDNDKDYLNDIRSSIIETNVEVFESYAEASKNRRILFKDLK